MRIKLKGGLVPLVALFAVGFAGVSSASAALPEFAGTFPTNVRIESGQITLRAGGTTVGCKHSTGEGKITGAKAGTAKLTFTGCEAPGTVCTTKGAAAGEIKTGTLPLALAYISKASKEVGLILDYQEPSKTFPPPPPLVMARFNCGGASEGKIQRSVIGTITPINTKTKTFTVTLSQESGHQKPTQYENEKGEKLSAFPEISWFGGPALEGSIETSVTLKSEGEAQITA